MAIYRGPGGAGDATVDATNNAALVAIRTQQATDAATAAAASAAEAAASAVIASDGLDGIAAYAAAAAGSAADALASEVNAADSETNAATSAANASSSASSASSSASSAATSASNAATSASNAATSASNAATSASNAASSATAANNSSINAANSATSAAASAASASGYLPSSTGNTGKYLRTNGTTNYWDNVTDVAAATITNDGVMFGFTDESTIQATTTYHYNTTVYSETPQSSLRGDGPPGHIAQTMAQAAINGDIVVGDPVKITVLHVATNVIQEINLGTVTSCAGSYNSSTNRWAFEIYTTNPSSWNNTGYYFTFTGLYIYDIITGPTSYGDENTQLGYNAGSGLTTGIKNVIIGSRSGDNVGTGSNNIIIGQGAKASATNVSNEITIGKSTNTKTRLFGALAMGGSSTGTSGQVLTSAGSGAAPTWSTPATGVTSVALSAPTGLTVSGSPVTTSGTLALSYTAGYSIPTTASQTNWDTAYGWGNHASAGYLTGITSGQVTGALGYTPENAANKNAANGYAGLDSSGLVPSSILPSYVDDVLEYANLASFPGTGATGKIYVALDTNKTYRWSGSAYIEISASPGSTDAVTEGSTNLYFTNARARAAISATGSLSYDSTTGIISYTTPSTSGITEGTNLYYTDARARSALSASTGISYNSTTGAISSTITQYTDALARAAISVSGSLSYNSTTGVISYTTPSSVTSVTGTSPVVSSGGTTPAISLASGYGDTQNPFASKTANYILAAPNGTAGAPTFRALVAADVPTLNQNTTGTAANITATSNSTLTTLSALSLPGSQVSGNISGNAANVTGTVAIANGGSGQTTAQTAMNAFAGAVTSGSYLRGNGTNVVMSTIQVADVPTLNQNTTGTAANVTGTVAVANGGTGSSTLTANNVLLGNGTSALQVVAPGTSGNVLTSNGTTWVSSAPSGGGSSYAGPSATTYKTAGSYTFTIPTGVTKLKVIVVGGGGGSYYEVGCTPYYGGSGGTSSVASGTQTISTISATGGSGNNGSTSSGGLGSGGDLNARGGPVAGQAIAGTSSLSSGNTGNASGVLGAGGIWSSYRGGGGGGTATKWLTGLTPGNTLSVTVGAGGTSSAGYPGGAGVVIFEY